MTKAIIHLDRFLSNFNAVKERIGHRQICVPVKADAYGHGAIQIAKACQKAGAFCLGTATEAEGTELRKAGITIPIMIFSQSHPERVPNIIESRLIPFVSDKDFASVLNNEAEARRTKLPVHMKIDTGMGRLGCSTEEAVSLARHIDSCSYLELAGTATHFAVADSTDEPDIAYTKKQSEYFKEAVERIKAEGIDPGILHAANSGAVILHPDTWLDMVRPGIFLYGYKTAEESEAPPEHRQKLTGFKPLKALPVMELKTTVSLIKKIKKGETVSYGRIWTAPQDTYIAILPLGYADGFPRLASNKWHVVIGGKLYPLVGRVTMDQICVDLGPAPEVNRWEEAVVFGGSANDAAGLADVTGTIPYEITCSIGNRVERSAR